MSGDERPTGLKSNKGIELLTFGTPNGWKASILLEELKEAYGKDFTRADSLCRKVLVSAVSSLL
jgi:glutathione S-transferase